MYDSNVTAAQQHSSSLALERRHLIGAVQLGGALGLELRAEDLELGDVERA